jgi:branched-chain amino acid transport system substrate-binding protein
MSFGRRTGLTGGVMAALLLLGPTAGAPEEAGKKIKIGVVYDYSGPLAAGGSDLHALGTKIIIDYFNKRAGLRAIRSSRSTRTRKASPMSPSTKLSV